jgi:hypothetical protein
LQMQTAQAEARQLSSGNNNSAAGGRRRQQQQPSPYHSTASSSPRASLQGSPRSSQRLMHHRYAATLLTLLDCIASHTTSLDLSSFVLY